MSRELTKPPLYASTIGGFVFTIGGCLTHPYKLNRQTSNVQLCTLEVLSVIATLKFHQYQEFQLYFHPYE